MDTGSQVSLVGEEFVKLLDPQLVRPAQTPKITLVSATGHQLKATRSVKIRITLGKVRMYHDFIVVTDFKHDMILGIDFLNSRKALLDFEHQTLIIGNAVYPLKEKVGRTRKEINLVRLAEAVDVFPRSDVQVKCSISKKKQPGENFVVSQLPSSPCFGDEPGVLLPNAVVKMSKNKHVPWAIVNETGRFLHFRKGQVLGTASKFMDNEQSSNVTSVTQSEETRAKETPADKLRAFNLEHIPEQQRQRLTEALTKHLDIFVQTDAELTTTNVTEMRINTQDHPPTYQHPRRPPLAYREALEKQVQEMLAANIIRRSNSPWMSPVILVPKKDGSIRLCIDFRKLNAITIRPAASIPSADDIFFALGKSKFRSCLDMKQGFWQIPIREEDKEKTAFGTDAGIFEHNRMSFGLTGSPAVFQNCMNAVLGDVRHFALAFVDDIIVFSETFEEHMTHLEEVFERLQKANLKLKISKCEFMKKQLNYLGHIISDDGISVDSDKVAAVQNMQPPKTIRDVRSFLGMASYYRKYVPNFSKIAKPLNALTRKHAKFNWTAEAQSAFDTLKQSLLEAPVLAFPDISKPFKLYTDASQYALGAVLMQEQDGENRAIQYISHQFSEQKLKWPTIEREAFAIIYSLEKLRPIVIGTDITVYTDHKPLKHLFTSEMKNPRIQRWAIILGEYGCQIEYISGPQNVAADMLSRLHNTPVETDLTDNEHLDWRGEGTNINAVNSSDVNVIDNGRVTATETDERPSATMHPLDYHKIDSQSLKLAQRNDEELRQIITGLQTGETLTNTKYCMEDELLFHVERGTKTRPQTRMQLVLPPSFRKMVLQSTHDGYMGGHLGIEKTTDKILKSYFWPSALKDVIQYVQSCETCNRKKLSKERRPMQDMPMPSAPMEIIGIDTCGPFPISDDGNKYVCTIVDHFSGWPEAWAIPDKSAATIAKLLLEEFIPRHGCPRVIISDQGTEYCNALLNLVNKELGISRIHTSSYHPQSNGKTERFHRCMNEMIQKQISENQTTWDRILQPCLGAYRVSKNESTKYSPYFVMYGRDPVLPIDTLLQPRLRYAGEDYVPVMFEHLHNAYSEVVQNMQQSRERNKALIAQNATSSNFQPGDPVFYFDPSVQPGDTPKFTLPWKNYFRVVSKLGEENYRIKNMQTHKTKIVHSENLRHREEGDVWNRTYDTARRPIQVGMRPESDPLREQPLRAARLPFSDRPWYSSMGPPGHQSAGESGMSNEREHSTELQGEETAPPPENPSAATGNPTVVSPPSPDSGEHGKLSPPPQRQHRYDLRSQRTGEPLEGYTYVHTRPYVRKRRHDSSCDNATDKRFRPYVSKRRHDSSGDRMTDKRLRTQSDADCLAVRANGPNDDTVPQYPFVKMNHRERSVSSDWLPAVSRAIIFALVFLFLGAI